MFCSNCGAQIGEGEKFCANCGAPVGAGSEVKKFVVPEEGIPQGEAGGFGQNAGNSANGAYEQGIGNGAGRGANSGNFTYAGPMGMIPRKTDRSFWLYLLLTWVTCGIYNLIFMYEVIRDVNIACEGDGEETQGLLVLILLSIVTCGIYTFIWYYKLGNRLSKNCKRYGYNVSEDGVTVLLWMILSSWLCGIGTYVAKYIIISQTNMVCTGYNRANGLA